MKMVFTLLVCACTLSNAMEAQNDAQTIYMDALMHTTVANKSSYQLKLQAKEENRYFGEVYDGLNKIKSKGEYIPIGKRFIEDGYFTFYHPNGQIESQGEYVRGVKVGNWQRYDANGNRKADKYYPAEGADIIRASMKIDVVDENE